MNLRGIILLLIIGVSSFANTFAKDNLLTESNYISSSKQINRLKVFIEGRFIDFDYIRRNINFVDFINDPKSSDVHVIVTDNRTGGGGTNYILNFYSNNLGQVGNISLNCISNTGDTEDEIRECITRSLKLGLMPYFNETANNGMIDISYTREDEPHKTKSSEIDKWNQWVFRLNANGGFNFQESKTNYNYSFNGRADKISEKYKIRAFYWMRNRVESFKNEGDVIISENSHKFSNLETVYSLTDRWSTGVFLSYSQNKSINTRFNIGIKPAIEYNFFPWEESDKRVFTIAYFAGWAMVDYFETTIYDQDNESLWAHNIRMNFELTQPWGEIETQLEGSSYWSDISKNRFTFRSNLSYRITRGLSLNFDFMASSIHDELWKPKTEYSLEDILLGNVSLPSTFRLSGGMGISIQFGSLYNNIVNNRL